MNENSVYILNESWNLHKEEINDYKYYLFNIKEGDIIRLNEISYVILASMDGSRTLKEIMRIVKSLFDVQDSVLVNDFSRLLEKCNKNKVLNLL